MRQRTLRGWNSSFNSRFPLDVKSVLMTASNQNRLRKYLRTRGSIVSSLTNMNWAAKSTSVRMHLNIENNTTHPSRPTLWTKNQRKCSVQQPRQGHSGHLAQVSSTHFQRCCRILSVWFQSAANNQLSMDITSNRASVNVLYVQCVINQ